MVPAATPSPTREVRDLYARAMFHAFLRFIERPGTSVRAIWQEERCSVDGESPLLRDVVPYETMLKVARRDKWRDRRVSHWEEIRTRVLAHAQSEAVQAEIHELDELARVRKKLNDLIHSDDAPPAKSLEATINALLKLDKQVSDKRAGVMEGTASAAAIGPSIAQADTTPILDGDFDLDETDYTAMSRALATRRAGVIEEQEIPDDAGMDLPEVLSGDTVGEE